MFQGAATEEVFSPTPDLSSGQSNQVTFECSAAPYFTVFLVMTGDLNNFIKTVKSISVCSPLPPMS